MARLHAVGTFLATATSVAANSIEESQIVSGTDFTTKEIDVTSVESIAITVEVTGANAAINALIDVNFLVSVYHPEDAKYDTANVLSQVFTIVSCQSTTNAAERSSAVIGVEGFARIAIGRIRNNDLNHAVSVQVYWGKYERIE